MGHLGSWQQIQFATPGTRNSSVIVTHGHQNDVKDAASNPQVILAHQLKSPIKIVSREPLPI